MEVRKIKKISTQHWISIEEIYSNGIVKTDKNKFIKILKIIPINYNLKSDLEKKTILNSYKILLKTCNFNFQILIQSNKENLEKIISDINFQKNKEKEKIKKISENYINYIKELNKNKKSSNKNFYIIIKNNIKDEKVEENVVEELNENYFKIKECLARCGNIVKDINKKENAKKLIQSFINKRLLLLENL